MSDFKQGEEIEVSNWDKFINDPISKPERRLFAVEYDGLYYCEIPGNHDSLAGWRCARTIQEPKRIPYTFETFPRGLVYIRCKAQDCQHHLVTIVMGSGIYATYAQYKYTTLMDNWQISLDNCENWQPASQEVRE